MYAQTYKSKSGETLKRPVLEPGETPFGDIEGWCLHCGEPVFGVEPDARKYTCEMCGKPKVYGLEELTLMGILTVSEDYAD